MKTYRMTLLTAAAALLSAAGLARDAGAAITQTFNYQGFLLDKATNLPVDGAKHVRFLIYPAASGGSALFTEMVCGVPMNKGRYEVEVGSQTSGGIPADIFIGNQNLWMQVEIAPTAVCGGSFDPLSPRMRLQAAAFAFNSLYASTASAATPLFSADVIGPLSQTANGAITISTNLFVQGGISVGSISPGQQLSVSGLVESRGAAGCAAGPNYTCGFKFPDGSVQVTAAAETKWVLNGSDMYTEVTIQRVGIGETAPRARLHISSGIGSAGNIVLISTGSSDLIRMTGEGRIYANYFHGDGSNLTGATAADLLRLLKAGDTMTGPLTLSGSSSMTVVNTNNSLAYSLAVTTDPARLAYHFSVSTAGFVGVGTVFPSRRLHVWAPPGTGADLVAVTTGTSDVFRVDGAGNVHGLTFHGNGSGLTDVFSTDPTRVLKAGDAMTGQLTLAGSSLTVRGSAGLAVSTGTWLSVGASTAAHKVYIDGGVLVTSSVTAQGGFIGPSASLLGHLQAGAVTATSGTFTNFGDGKYSIITTSGIKVGDLGFVEAPFYLGSGAYLTNVLGTDSSKVRKAGDVMTGSLRVEGSSVGLFGYGGSFAYALTVATVTNPSSYALAVTTQGRVGVGVLTPSYPFHVLSGIGVTVPDNSADAKVTLQTAGGGAGYIAWDDTAYPGIGILGAPFGGRDLVYRAAATSMANGTEVFRIKENGSFGIGTAAPSERFHVATNMLVSTSAVNPLLYVSSVTGRVGIGTNSPQTHRLVVNGGMVVASSLTVQNGIHGTIYGIISSTELYVDGNAGIGVSTPLARLHVVEKGNEIYSLIVGSNNIVGLNYDLVVTTQGRVGIGIANPQQTLHVGGTLKVGSNDSLDTGSARLQLRPLGGHSLISFESTGKGAIAVMGTDDTPEDFIFRTDSASLGSGTEIYRIKKTGQFGIYNAAPEERLHIGGNTLISTAAVTPIMFVSTGTARVGVGTRSPSARLHLSSGAFYNDGTGAGITTLGNVTAAAYYGNGANLSGVITSTDVIVADIAARVRKDGDTMSGPLITTGLTVTGAANFGSLPTKSTFTADGFWQPRAMTTTELRAATPPGIGLVVYNSTIPDLCVSTGTATAGAWALIGSRAAGNCY
ncbi:MAG: hypothetical protein FD189_21 [Elusimicrobia bacterium]|nr:MAG: hypothetical protein FD154_173 [Elusimicrobiota bacterium]KAF0158379.1 MAG: hypothetical protein FD189_21 [Elusimicrobiota bacterium]